MRVDLSSGTTSVKSKLKAARISQNSVAEATFVGLVVLFRAHRYAVDTGCDIWDFAVEIAHLRSLGLTNSDLRWLVRKGYVEHAREVTLQGDDGRQFRSTGDLTFGRRTCFVLTEDGVSKARTVTENQAAAADNVNGPGETNGRPIPHWDAETRELHMNGKIVKRFKWQAVNQELVLSVFEEDGWPTVIDDPLPPKPEQHSKRRLQDTIKALNRSHEYAIIQFHGNGTGEGIRWEVVDADEVDP